MKQRPALCGASAVITGILLARWTSVVWWIPASIALLFILASFVELILYRGRRGRDLLVLISALPALLCAGAAAYAASIQLQDRHHISRFLTVADTLTVTCQVIDEPQVSDGRTKFLAEVTSLSGEVESIRTEGKAYVTILADKRRHERPAHIPYGSTLTFRTVVQAPGAERNPGEFSYREYLVLNNIYATMTVRGYANVTVSAERNGNPFFEYIIFPSKAFVVKNIRTVMTGDEMYFLIGLLLGDRTELSDDIKIAFMNTGTIHVLAVSGSHVVLVAEIIVVLVGLFRLPRVPRILLVMVMLLYYMYLTGATPSVVRATLMMLVMMLGKLYQQRTDIYNLLGVSALIILLIEPKQLFDVGFQLSFSAVFSIVYFYPKLNALIPRIPEPLEEIHLMQWLWQLFAVSLAAQVGTLPFTAYYFGRVSIVSLLANLVVVPLVGVIVTIGLSGALLGIISMWAASCYSEVNQVIAVVTLKFVKWAEQVPYAVVDTATFGWKETIFYSVLIGMLFHLGQRSVVKRYLFAGLAAANIFLFLDLQRTESQELRVAFLDVGQGDGAVIRFPDGKVVLVDAGPWAPDNDAGEKVIAPYLRRNGISAIDAVITTHPHADHLGGVPYLLRSFSVREAIDQGQHARSKLYDSYEQMLGRIPRHIVRAGDMLEFGGARLYVLHPTASFIDADSSNGYSDLNGSSVVFKLQYGTTSMLFTGDAETDAEEQMVRLYGDFLHSDLLKAGHHGSSTSSSEGFISYVRPTDAVVSVAQFNKFRHPSKKVIARLEAYGVRVHRTDKEGAVIFVSDGATIRPHEWRDPP